MNMAGNPSRWSMHPASQFPPSPSLFPSQSVFGTSSSSSSPSLPFNPLPENLELPHQSWSQLLVGGLPGGEDQEEDRYGLSHFQQIKKLGNWEEQMLNLNPPFSRAPHPHPHHVVGDIKQNINLEGNGNHHEQFYTPKWSHNNPHHQVNIPHVSSPRSCVTTSPSTNMLDFSYTNNINPDASNHQPDQSSECKITGATGGASKKARVQPSSSQPPLKVRKEKLGDRITALHQLVSPFGKTDTASVLLEAIGYIRFLQGQIEALSSPYLTTSSSNMMNNQISVHGERNSVFPEDPGQLLNDICLKRKGGPNLQQDSQDNNSKPKDLRSRGLCLVRLSCTQNVGNDNGADFWAPATGGSGF